jgi:hypothetical protein
MLLLYYDCMADTQDLNESPTVLVLPLICLNIVSLSLEIILIKFRIIKINICKTLLVHFLWRIWHSIALCASCEFLELHNVLCKSACLIREDIVNHTKFLIQVTWLHLSWHVFLHIINHIVPGDELSLNELDYFESDHQRDRHQVHEDDEPSAKLNEEVDDEFLHALEV